VDKKKKSKHQAPSSAGEMIRAQESNAANALTVGWMLAVMAVTAADIAAGLTYAMRLFGNPPGGLIMFSNVCLFVGMILGLVAIGLVPVVLRMRKYPPPQSVVAFAIIVGAAPILAVIAQMIST